MTEKFSLEAIAREQLNRATSSTSHRSSTTVLGGHEHRLRHTVIALLAGAILAEHDNPGEATLIVLRGRVRLHSDDTARDGRTGNLILVPAARHSLEALEDSAVLLTVTI